MKRWLFAALAACTVAAAPALIPSSVARAAEASPEATVRAFHDVLLGLVRDGAPATPQQRYDRVAAAVAEAFDTALMARIAGGSAWKNADADGRQKLESAIHRFSAALYASRFDEARGAEITVERTGPGPGATKLVTTTLKLPQREPVEMIYVLRRQSDAGGWRIADVLLDGGISQLAQRRSEYHRIAADEGAPGLIKALNDKADQLLNQP